MKTLNSGIISISKVINLSTSISRVLKLITKLLVLDLGVNISINIRYCDNSNSRYLTLIVKFILTAISSIIRAILISVR